MELEKMMIEWVLERLQREDCADIAITLEVALNIVNGLSPWDAEKALKCIFGGVANAE